MHRLHRKAARLALERLLPPIALALCTSAAALAQNAPAADEGASAEISGGLKEIVVTASLRKVSMAELPMAHCCESSVPTPVAVVTGVPSGKSAANRPKIVAAG